MGLKDDNKGLVGEVRLMNSDVLASLHSKLDHLVVEERDSMANLIYEFPELFTDVPKKTNAIQHDVDVGDVKPCKQHPYQVNSLKVKHMKSEIKYMSDHNIIEPSNSE